MDRRILGIPLVVIGCIVLLGCFLAGALLIDMTAALEDLSSDPLLLGADTVALKSELSRLMGVVWLWVIAAFLAAVACIYFGVQYIRKKR
jgi:hypothetical protein